MFTPMHTPSTRAEFEERMNYLREHLKQGLMHFSRTVPGPENLLNVRYLPNQRIDLLSIDETARLNANMTYQMRNADFGGMHADDVGQ
ncbi:MAG: AVAST type 1 anti-phage system protein Avs1c [Candidatus Accumulibacter necessarius]|jgi:hypothetical protein|uniref:AVAST type 1 anti-phage system protein Avs1c n=1 Tax=Candidatus Accumulibacter necessarius TaxID=2954386 RepID=UPI002FC36573